MKKKIVALSVVLLILISGGIFYMTKWIQYQNSPYNVSDVLDDKGVKLYKRGFKLLEEQLATYIKEHYSGVSKIEFSPIFVQGGDGQSMFNANIVPALYDEKGDKTYLGRKIGNEGYARYGLLSDVILSFDGVTDEEVIELKVGDDEVDVSKSQHLPDEAKLSSNEKIDENIEALAKDGQLKDVVKSKKGSPKAEVIYNIEIRKGDHLEWR